MKYTQLRDVKHSIVDHLRKMFAMNTTWINDGLEVIELDEGNSPKIEEQFPFEAENYAIVVVAGASTTPDEWAIDNLITDAYQTKWAGIRSISYETMDNTNQFAYGIQFTEDVPIRNISIALKQNKNFAEPIDVCLYGSGSYGLGTTLSSGSIKGFEGNKDITWGTTELTPEYTLIKNTPYFIGLQLAPTRYGSYYLMTDNVLTGTDNSYNILGISGSNGWNFTENVSPVSIIEGPVYRLLGGGLNITFSVLIEAKDLSTVQKISELCFVYLTLLRYGKLQRESLMDNPNQTRIEYNREDNMLGEGIGIVSIEKGAESVRERGNDRIFSVTLSVACYGRWSEEFTLPTIKEIDLDINKF
jgi:hypothetical protein